MISILILCMAVASAHGHFLLTAPATRGMNEDIMTQAPCGGFNTPSVNRTVWALGTPIQITSYHPNAIIKTYLSLSTNPKNLSDFQEFSSVKQDPMGKLTLDFKLNAPPPDFLTKLGVQNANALVDKMSTIMVSYDGGDGVLYQCGDTILTAASTTNAAAPAAPASTPKSSATMLNAGYVWVLAVCYFLL